MNILLYKFINISFNLFKSYLIMRHRNKYDWTKPFKFIDNKKIFDQLDTNQDTTIISIIPDEVKPIAPHKK